MDTTAAIYVSALPDIVLQKRADYLAFLKYTDGPFYYFHEKDIHSNLLQVNAYISPPVDDAKVEELWKNAQSSFFRDHSSTFRETFLRFLGRTEKFI